MNAQTFSALAEPNRLDIVDLLLNGPLPVGEIAGKLELNQPQTSKHLRVLCDAGLVEVQPVANRRCTAGQEAVELILIKIKKSHLIMSHI
jgi:DNA-binding transcriptional ArsR family regulator